MIRVGVIGYGYWGPNLARNFAELPNASLAAVADLDPRRLELAARRFPGIHTTTDYRDLLSDPAIDAVAITTPVATHYPLAMACLQAGKHVLVEKPITETADQALRLIEEAERRALTLMVDHTFLYTGPIRKIRELIQANELGKLYYYDSVRINLGLFQNDVDVLWDLAVHDLAILDYLLQEQPIQVSACGASHVPGKPANIAYGTYFFESGIIAHINVNWLSPVKIRRTVLGGDRKMIVYDDLEPSEKIKIHNKGIEIVSDPAQIHQMRVGYRMGDMLAPQCDQTEGLRVATDHFVQSIQTRSKPLTDGAMGWRIVHLLEITSRSMQAGGTPHPISWSHP